MKCNYCQFEHPEPFSFCPACGCDNRTPATQNTAADKMLPVLKSKLFLVLCILSSAACFFSLINDSFSVVQVLITVFHWIVYSKARKGTVDAKQLRNVSGAVFANYVINYVLAGIFIFAGIIFGIVCFISPSFPDLYNSFMEGFNSAFEGSGINPDEFAGILADMGVTLEVLISMLGVLMLIVFTVIGIALIILNALGIKKLHRFAKSVYKSVENGVWEPCNINAAYGWLIALSVLSGISAFSSVASGDFLGFISNGLDASVTVLSVILIKKHLISRPVQG